MSRSDGLRGREPPFDGLLWLPARAVQAEVQVARRLRPVAACRAAVQGRKLSVSYRPKIAVALMLRAGRLPRANNV